MSSKETETSHGLRHFHNLFLPLVSSVLPSLDQLKLLQRELQGIKILQVVVLPTCPPISRLLTEFGCSEVPINTYFVLISRAGLKEGPFHHMENTFHFP